MIAFSDTWIAYRNGAPVIRGVSLEASRGSLTAITGPNGSGKSTLVRALLGRVQVHGGTITLAGDELSSLSRREIARRVAVVTQREEPAFPLRVRDFVALGRHAHGGLFFRTAASEDATVEQAMSRADVTSLSARLTNELSGGEWQRVRVARALAQGAPAIVLDEPTTYLDVAHEMSLFELLESLAGEGHAVLLVSHQLNLVSRFAARMVLLDSGTVVASGAPADVMTREILEQVYRWPLLVAPDAADGSPSLVPLRRHLAR